VTPEVSPVTELEKSPIPVPSVVFVEKEIVGFVLVFQTTPRAVTKAPPSDPMDPPVVNELEVIAVATEVALRVGRAN
jgi:hypothetical protein